MQGLFFYTQETASINIYVYRPLTHRKLLTSPMQKADYPVKIFLSLSSNQQTKEKTTQQKKYWKTTHWDTNILACYQWSVTFNFFLGACSSSHWCQWAFHYQLQWELAKASVIFLLDWQGMQTLEMQHGELLMGGNGTSAALWLIKKWALNVNLAQLLQGQQP